MSLPPTLLPETQEDHDVFQKAPVAVIYSLECLEGDDRSTTFTPMTDVSIGRDQSTCKLSFPECMLISRIHCKIFSLGRDVFVEDLSSNGTFINGKCVGKNNRKAIRNGDIISVMNPSAPESSRFSWRFMAPSEDEDMTVSNASTSSQLEGVYELGKVLGTGNFATVRLGKHRGTGRQVAVKIIEKKRFALNEGEFSFAALQSEVEVLRKMQHRNIISLFDVFDEPKIFAMVLELVSGGDFFDYIVGRCPSPFSEPEAKCLFVQLLEALLYMHSKDVVHRDLKPENILVLVSPHFEIPHKSDDNQRNAVHIPVDKVTLKVTDFGLAKFCKDDAVMKTMCGTPAYLAPEVQDKAQAGYSWTVDVWSLGVILYIMLSGCPPTNPAKGNLVFHKSMASLSSESKNLIENMLKVSVRDRYDLVDICQHPWLKGVDIPSAHLAVHKERLQLCLTMALSPVVTTDSAVPGTNPSIIPVTTLELSTTANTAGTATDGEDSDGSPTKKRRLDSAKGVDPSAGDGKITVWYWKKHLNLPDSNASAWQSYSDQDSANIERQRQKQAKSCRVGNTTEYRISFEGMFQYNTKDTTKQRPVKYVRF
jgi:serine/threonine protein kinase